VSQAFVRKRCYVKGLGAIFALHFGNSVDGPVEPRRKPANDAKVQWWRARRDGCRADGTASTMTQSPSIASPMNSNTSASAIISPEKAASFVGPH